MGDFMTTLELDTTERFRLQPDGKYWAVAERTKQTDKSGAVYWGPILYYQKLEAAASALLNLAVARSVPEPYRIGDILAAIRGAEQHVRECVGAIADRERDHEVDHVDEATVSEDVPY
jgi:hypothetical protein